MGGKRQNQHVLQRLPSGLLKTGSYRNAYIEKEGTRPLIAVSKIKTKRSKKGQKLVSQLNRAFESFYETAPKSPKEPPTKFNTKYDLHRDSVHMKQTGWLQAKCLGIIMKESESMGESEFTMLDVGCGTGKLLRRIVRTPPILDDLEAHKIKMRILGVDLNHAALEVAMAKTDLLFEHHPKLGGDNPALVMEYVLLDLKDLSQLDLSKTCIGAKTVDMVMASDIFRWLRKCERFEILRAITAKIRMQGHLVSMEFTNPPLPMTSYPSIKKGCMVNLIKLEILERLSSFSVREQFTLSRAPSLYTQMTVTGFLKMPGVGEYLDLDEDSPFPRMSCAIFQRVTERRGAERQLELWKPLGQRIPRRQTY